jgi:hypothetical protein
VEKALVNASRTGAKVSCDEVINELKNVVSKMDQRDKDDPLDVEQDGASARFQERLKAALDDDDVSGAFHEKLNAQAYVNEGDDRGLRYDDDQHDDSSELSRWIQEIDDDETASKGFFAALLDEFRMFDDEDSDSRGDVTSFWNDVFNFSSLASAANELASAAKEPFAKAIGE